jgi:hypothetical protein
VANEQSDHILLRRIYQISSEVGDWPSTDYIIDPSRWHQWLPEPECETKVNAYRRLLMEGRYEQFLESKRFYKKKIGRKFGRVEDEIFYLALRHFPPGG